MKLCLVDAFAKLSVLEYQLEELRTRSNIEDLISVVQNAKLRFAKDS